MASSRKNFKDVLVVEILIDAAVYDPGMLLEQIEVFVTSLGG
jgi:hypothetical protein